MSKTPGPDAYSVSAFCAAHSISRSAFYALPPEKMPRLFRIGTRVLISRESAAEWRRRMEAATEAAA